MKARNFTRWMMQEDINFLLTNRIPRITLTRLMGWFSRIESPWLARLSIAVWRLFTELDLSDAKEARFSSLHACFTRSLKDGARPVDMRPEVLVSPCDAIVGSHGAIAHGQVFQAKGMAYSLRDLLGAEESARMLRRLEGGTFVTLRLTSAMYHRFHAPADLTVDQLTYISGDTWNVNPIALKRVERLFCRNERAVIRGRLNDGNTSFVMVPVAAVLVASMRFHFADVLMNLRWPGPNRIPCRATLTRGQEMGWFEHGSTIIMLLPCGFELMDGITAGTTMRMGQALVRRA